MGTRTGRFERADRLLDSKDFERVSRQGQRTAGGEFVILTAPGACLGRSRVGISASRKVGNAVVRNRIKRRVRDWFRHRRVSLANNVDLVIIARKKAGRLVESGAIAKALDDTLARAQRQGKKTT